MNVTYPERLQFAHLPTPVERLERLTAYLGGPELYIKRDDQTGLALGGNKTRKLEFLCADALANDCNHLITCGASQSNHCRQTAAAAAHLGLSCSLVLSGEEPEHMSGNLLISQMMGADQHWIGERTPEKVMAEIAGDIRKKGGRPYTIPRGGSDGLGALGYVLAMEELSGQLEELKIEFDLILLASSSGGTQAGVVLGKEVYQVPGEIIGICIDILASESKKKVSEIANDSAQRLGLNHKITTEMVLANDRYIGPGSGILSDLEREAIRLFAELEGILLDPVYTGRAAGALISELRIGNWTDRQRILFWHTGGTPALFAYGDEL